MLIVGHGQMDGAGRDGRLGGGGAEGRAEEEIAQGAVGHSIRGIERGLRQFIRKNIVVVTVSILRLIKNAVAGTEYGAVAKGPVGHANTRSELRLVSVGDVEGNSSLARGLDEIPEILIGHRRGVLRGQVHGRS